MGFVKWEFCGVGVLWSRRDGGRICMRGFFLLGGLPETSSLGAAGKTLTPISWLVCCYGFADTQTEPICMPTQAHVASMCEVYIFPHLPLCQFWIQLALVLPIMLCLCAQFIWFCWRLVWTLSSPIRGGPSLRAAVKHLLVISVWVVFDP